MGRPTNQELCKDFRDLLTHTARKDLDEETLLVTKRWRNKLWKAFDELEDRLLPLKVIDKERQKNEG